VLLFLSTQLEAITIAKFAQSSTYLDVKLSPKGDFVGILFKPENEQVLVIFDVKTNATVGGTRLTGKDEVGDFFWINNDRLIIKPVQRKSGQEQLTYYGELFAVNIDGSQSEVIYGYRAGSTQTGSSIKKKKATRGWAEIIDILPEDKKHILISSTPMSKKRDRFASVFKLNVYTGKMQKVKRAPVPGVEFITNLEGELVLATGVNKKDQRQVFHLDKNNMWQELTGVNYSDEFNPIGVNALGNAIYALDYGSKDKLGLYQLDLQTGDYQEIFTDTEVDITHVQRGVDRRSIYALRIDPDYPTYVMLDKGNEEAQLFKKFIAFFPGHKINITSKDDKGRLYVVHVSTVSDPGRFYLYDKQKNTMSLLFNVIDNFPRNELVDVTPIEFIASDKQKIHGYLTQNNLVEKDPNEQAALPMVVLVHGGPHGPRDYWSYDSEVQMLASQGYRVLQLNFRGSGGYGKNFMKLGFRHWGDRIQQDIIEGTRWAIEQGYAIKDKVCIMGGSFGGYSAVQSAIMAPDLFRCVVANAGVYDLELMFDVGDIPKWYRGKSYLTEVLGEDEQQLRAFSPVHNVDKLRAPVFIAHGEEDIRVPIEHAKRLKDALNKHNKEYVWFVKSTETHGFYKEENRAEYYLKLSLFIGKYL